MNRLYSYIFVLLALTTVGNWITIRWWAPNLTIFFLEECLMFFVLLYPTFKYRHFQYIRKEKAFFVFNIYAYYTIALTVLALTNQATKGVRADFANLMTWNMAMLTCFCVYTLSYPEWFQKSVRLLFKYLPIVAVIYLPFVRDNLYGDLLGFICTPAILLLLFFKDLPKKQKVIWFLFTILIVVTSFVGDARSNVIKFALAFLIGVTFVYDKFYMRIRQLVWLLVAAPFFLFFMGISGTFNIFEMDQYIKTKSVREGTISDTRTFLYVEVLSSAVDNDYIVWGRGIGRGYESHFQERRSSDKSNVTDLGASERQSEVGIHNIFTWGGVVYVFIHLIMWCSVLYYGVYKSKNRYVRAVGFYLAFYYFYTWVENFQSFSIIFISSWFMVALCLSPYFRLMNDREFKNFLATLFR